MAPGGGHSSRRAHLPIPTDMSRPVRFALLAAILGGAVAMSQETAEVVASPLSELTVFDGSAWAPLNRHAIYVTGAGATTAGTATATLKSKLDGPKTYVVLAGTTSEVVLKDPKPHFRIAAGRAGALQAQLAQFEIDDSVRSTPIERVRNGVFFTKAVDLELMEIREGLWELRPTKSLQPGEYGLVTSDTDPVADFTIIEKGY